MYQQRIEPRLGPRLLKLLGAALLGAALGALIGALVGYLSYEPGGSSDWGPEVWAISGGFLGIVIGAIVVPVVWLVWRATR